MKQLGRGLKPFIPHIILCFALLFLQAQCDLALPDYMSNIISNGIAVSDMDVIWHEGWKMIACTLIGMASAITVCFIASKVGSGMAKNMRKGLFVKISGFSGEEMGNFSTSSLITRSTNDITQVQIFTIILIRIVLYAPIIGVGGVFKAMDKSAGLPGSTGVIALAVIILLGTIIVLLSIAQPKVLRMQKLIDKVNRVAREGLSGMMIVRAFNNEKHEEERFDEVNKELTGVNLFVNRTMIVLMPVILFIMYFVSVMIVLVAAQNAQQVADVSNAMAFIQYAMQIIMAFMMVAMVFIMWPRANVAAKRIGEVMDTKSVIVDKENPVDAKNIKGEIVFDNVSFKYPGSDEYSLEHISFTAKPGETTAFIGGTGSGKSTVINLIPRMYDVTEGSVKIDGVDVRDYSQKSLRAEIGFVPQKNILFSGDIESNIKYGKDDANHEEVVRAARIAQAEEFVEEKKEKYEYPIAQGGSNVSGGQKQRLAIARAIIKNSPIYIFDDSFSALDFKTDAKLREALKENVAGSSVLIVAQRVGTIMNADKIIVLADGKIAGMGTHKELMQNCDVYREIAYSQLSEEELA